MPETNINHKPLVIQDRMPPGKRVLFLLLAQVPLLAPYELIVLPKWQEYWNLFFFFAALISLGALAVSAFLVWAAIAGLDKEARIDRFRGRFTYIDRAPVVPLRRYKSTLDFNPRHRDRSA